MNIYFIGLILIEHQKLDVAKPLAPKLEDNLQTEVKAELVSLLAVFWNLKRAGVKAELETE